jgi:hypothetical protein
MQCNILKRDDMHSHRLVRAAWRDCMLQLGNKSMTTPSNGGTRCRHPATLNSTLHSLQHAHTLLQSDSTLHHHFVPHRHTTVHTAQKQHTLDNAHFTSMADTTLKAMHSQRKMCTAAAAARLLLANRQHWHRCTRCKHISSETGVCNSTLALIPEHATESTAQNSSCSSCCCCCC